MLLSVLVFLFPLGAYCFILGRINRRRHPVLVTGVQDCAGLLLALSGFFLVIGPSILTGFHYRPRDLWLYYHYSSLLGLGHRWGFVGWTVLWLVYATVVIGGAGWMLGQRRRVSVVYNVDTAVFDRALERVLNRLELTWTRDGRQIRIGCRNPITKVASHEIVPAPHQAPWAAHVLATAVRPGGEVSRELPAAPPRQGPDELDQDLLLEVEPWAALRHVTLSWMPGCHSLRQDIEADLKGILAEVWTLDHSVGTWFQIASALLFMLMFLVTVLYQSLSLLGGRVGI